MALDEFFSYFAPAERSSPNEVLAQRRGLRLDPLVETLFDAVPEGVVVLNRNRQIVFANKSLLDKLNQNSDDEIVGKRLGEAVGCIHSDEAPGGCGTSKPCRMCGAVNAMLEAQKCGRGVGECRITVRDSGGGTSSLDLAVLATSLDLSDERYLIFAINDISDQKRRQALERVFFHDLLNTASGIRGFSELLLEENEQRVVSLAKIVYQASDLLINDISSYKNLVAAEKNELVAVPTELESQEIMYEVINLLSGGEFARGVDIKISSSSQNLPLYCDKNLLGRILINLLKNALEASEPGQTVAMESVSNAGLIEFRVHNEGYIPPDVQLQLFKRSFSTKGQGRGLGAYSVKLLTERYLKGRAGFVTDKERGTTFWVRLPIDPRDCNKLQ